MDLDVSSGSRRLLARGGAAALAALALESALGGPQAAHAQQLAPGSATYDTAILGDGADRVRAARHLALFDRLDFEAWNKPDWDLFRQLHSEHVHVESSGTVTDGIEAHVAWAQAVLRSLPDAKIQAHPIRIGAGDWTAVTGVLPGAKMVTVARWENDRIVEEYLFMG